MLKFVFMLSCAHDSKTGLVLTVFDIAGWVRQRQQAVKAKTITGSRHIFRGVRWRTKAIFQSVKAACSAATGDEGQGSKKQLKWSVFYNNNQKDHNNNNEEYDYEDFDKEYNNNNNNKD